MSKRNLILSIICWVVLLITVVYWIVTYFGLFSMDLRQSMLYIGFYNIEVYQGWFIGDIPKYLSESLMGVDSSSPPYISSFNINEFERQVQNSMTLFHLGYALITALSLAGGIVFTVLLVKKRKSKSLSNY